MEIDKELAQARLQHDALTREAAALRAQPKLVAAHPSAPFSFAYTTRLGMLCVLCFLLYQWLQGSISSLPTAAPGLLLTTCVGGCSAREPAASAPPLKEAAIVYFGNVGALDYMVKDQMLAGAQPWRMDAAAGARPYIEEHVLEFNAARGWRLDAFMHTWNAQLQPQLEALLAPLTNASYGPQLLHGQLVSGSMEASIELALALVAAHTEGARAGRPYDRLLLLRLDSIFYKGFDLDALVEGDAFYVASWCKAHMAGPAVPREDWPPGVLKCWQLTPYWADLEGVPDFWFAGGQAPVMKAFDHLYQDLATGVVAKGRTCSGCGHAKIWGALNGHAVKTRRYGFHQIDNE